MTSALSCVSEYSINLDRPDAVFWSGETITGTVTLKTKQPVTCRALRLKLECVSHVHETSEDSEYVSHYVATKSYLNYRQTLWGNFYSTCVINNAGANAIFSSTETCALGGGDMNIPLNTTTQPLGSFSVAVRVMDLIDWGKKEELLGEVLILPETHLLTNPGQPISFPLMRKGKKEKGEVTLSCTYEDGNVSTSGLAVLRMKCQQATGLRKAGWIGKNDVYVQAYIVPRDTPSSKALPEPNKNMTLPAGDIVHHFKFQVPWNHIPSSFESPLGDTCSVRYSLYSNIDVNWKLNPSTRTMITVLNSCLPSQESLVPVQRPPEPDQKVYACCCCILKGVTNMSAMLDRTSAAAEDTFYACAVMKNGTDYSPRARILLVRHELATMLQMGTTRTHTLTSDDDDCEQEWELFGYDMGPQSIHTFGTTSEPLPIKLPVVPPTYFPEQREPIKWRYTIKFIVEYPGQFVRNLEWEVPLTIGPAPPSVFMAIGAYQPITAPPQPIAMSVSPENIAPPMYAPQVNPDQVPLPFYGTPKARQTNFHSGKVGGEHDPKANKNEDLNNFGGAIPVFAPMYPTYAAMPTPLLFPLPSMPVVNSSGLKSNNAIIHPVKDLTTSSEINKL